MRYTKTVRSSMDRHRIPRIKDSLNFLKESGYDITYALDIGVHSGTPWLQYSFPNAHYVLVEPNKNHNEQIHKNYANFSYELKNVALGKRKEKLANLNLIGEEPYVSDIVTLDSLDIMPSGKSLFKLDVDGYEMDVLQGGIETFPMFDLLIIESKLDVLNDITGIVEDNSFRLWDIVNLDYEHGNLAQVDLIFKKNNFVTKPVAGYLDYQFFRQGSELQ